MFSRRIEPHQDGVFTDVESVRRYAESSEKSTLKYRAFLEMCRTLGIGARVLDVGAGPGVVSVLVANEFPHVSITATDVSAAMVEAGTGYVAAKNLQDRIHFAQGDAADADWMQSLGTFDFIYSTFTLHHWHDPQPVILNLRGLLNDDGVALLYDLRRAWWLYWVPSRSGFFRSVRGAYTVPEVRALLAGAGIARAEVRGVIPFLLAAIIRRG
jgi:SAM-dependent methyltransferase